ncbi:YhbY family RNA-binding protein [Candidatus Pacearchaeota archaeon]|nr:YhbY family RNA-binding protein [Candidatus Pacearchaeota archaeon]
MSGLKGVAQFQIGKAGITPGVVIALDALLKNYKQVRVSVLKSAGRKKETMLHLAEMLNSQLTTRCVSRVIGFTIILSRRGSKKQGL